MDGIRALRTTLRTLHLITFGALYGGHIYALPPERLHSALLATVATGAALLVLEASREPLWWVQVRGAATLGKLALVASTLVFPDSSVPVLTLVIAIGSVTSHMPGRYRYYSLRHGRVVKTGERG